MCDLHDVIHSSANPVRRLLGPSPPRVGSKGQGHREGLVAVPLGMGQRGSPGQPLKFVPSHENVHPRET